MVYYIHPLKAVLVVLACPSGITAFIKTVFMPFNVVFLLICLSTFSYPPLKTKMQSSQQPLTHKH